jgi:guanylate kinase
MAGIAARHLPLVIAGPSGVGKGTLSKLLFKHFPGQFGLSVSHTTRAPRDGEVDGVHYHFVKLSTMEAAIARGEFAEYARVHKNMYGTSLASIREVSEKKGQICLLDIDMQGCKSLRAAGLKTRGVFIDPPSMEALEARLRGRGTETEETLATRLGVAAAEMAYGAAPGNFDARLTNDALELCWAELRRTVEGWYPHLQAQDEENTAKQ